MTSYDEEPSFDDNPRRREHGRKAPPAINAPMVIVALIGLMTLIHAVRYYVLDDRSNWLVMIYSAFIPLRYDSEQLLNAGVTFPGGILTYYSTFLTYSFLHGDWFHLIVNAFWMLIFGSAVARRFGTLRFLLLSVIGSVGGALAHLYFHWGALVPMVGASAAISAHMACAARFAFVPYGPLGRPRSSHPGAYFLPALSLRGMASNVQVVSFLGIWFAINLFIGVGEGFVGNRETTQVAWQAHIGGFLAGLLAFPLLDPARRIKSGS